MNTLSYCPKKMAMPLDPFNRQGIFGTDISAILGIDPRKTAYELYLEKVRLPGGMSPPKAHRESPTALYMANEYAKLIEKPLCKIAPLQQKNYPFLMADPDRLVVGERRGLDIYPPKPSAVSKSAKTFKIPTHAFFQMAHHMLVLDYPRWDLIALQKKNQLSIYSFKRNVMFEQIIINAATAFWCNHVLKQCPPSIDYVHPEAAVFKTLELEQYRSEFHLDLRDP